MGILEKALRRKLAKAKTVARLPIIAELSGKFADPVAEVIRAKKNEEGAE